MTKSSHHPDLTVGRFPISCQQTLWCSGDEGHLRGTFGPRFIMASAFRVTGQIDVAELQAALDDVVVRHEILRTVVVRDAGSPYQQVHLPSTVSLQVKSLTPDESRSRDVCAEELLIEAKQGTLDSRELPGLRAILGTFDDSDSVLVLITHHSASDEWSMQLIMRDLAAFYTARTTGQPANLPDVPQYREYATWQQDFVAGPAAADALEYWREKLGDARVFSLPTDYPTPEQHTRPYSAHNFVIGRDVMTAASVLAEVTQSSPATILMAAVNVLAYTIRGTTDVVLDTFTSGRTESSFNDTAGPFLDFLVLRTDIGKCTSFREIVERTRVTCTEADLHAIPIQHVERELPELMQPYEHPRNANTIFGVVEPPFSAAALQLASGTYEIGRRMLQEPVSSEIPIGIAWGMTILSSGELAICVQFNLDEFDERTVSGWTSDYRRILSSAVAEPDQEWKKL